MFSKLSKQLNKNINFKYLNKHNFSTRFGLKEKLSNPVFGYALAGLGIGGLGLLMFNSGKVREDYNKSLLSSGNLMEKSISQQRTRDTVIYFTGGLFLTSAITALMLRSPSVLRASNSLAPILLTLPASIYCMYKVYTTPMTPKTTTAKHLAWVAFNGLMAFSLVPLIAVSELAVIRDAFLVTSGAMAGLGLVAYNSKDDSFIGTRGILSACLGGITAVGIANIFLKSNALNNIWIYGGLALFLAFVIYDVKEVQVRAKHSLVFDPMAESIKIYLDFVNIFIRLLYIMNNRQRRN